MCSPFDRLLADSRSPRDSRSRNRTTPTRRLRFVIAKVSEEVVIALRPLPLSRRRPDAAEFGAATKSRILP